MKLFFVIPLLILLPFRSFAEKLEMYEYTIKFINPLQWSRNLSTFTCLPPDYPESSGFYQDPNCNDKAPFKKETCGMRYYMSYKKTGKIFYDLEKCYTAAGWRKEDRSLPVTGGEIKKTSTQSGGGVR